MRSPVCARVISEGINAVMIIGLERRVQPMIRFVL